MAMKDYKAFIVEGSVREPQIINNLYKVHFKDSNFKIFTLPAGQNIYMIWKKLKQDDFETDIIEILRESNKELEQSLKGLERDDFSEVFLFFDYDGQQNNLSDKDGIDSANVISQMLETFDNETENGRLYISYPMAEALRDFVPDSCGAENDCFCFVQDFWNYKQISAQRSSTPEFKKYTFSEWKDILNVFVMRISCLFSKDEMISYDEYRNEVTPSAIYQMQKANIIDGKVFILSAFPEFLLDYFTDRFWKSCLIHTRILPEKCSKIR